MKEGYETAGAFNTNGEQRSIEEGSLDNYTDYTDSVQGVNFVNDSTVTPNQSSLNSGMASGDNMISLEEDTAHRDSYEDDEIGDAPQSNKVDRLNRSEKDNRYDGEEEFYDDEEYLAEVGEMRCYCVPNRVVGVKDFFQRTFDWLQLNKEQIMSALTVSMTQIPEAISSAMIVGVNPAVALQGTWIMNIVTSLIGGRPGMVSGATIFVAVALADLVENEGANYIYYAVMFGGILQIIFGLLGMGAFVRLLPHPVVQGFSNAMGLVIIAAQFRYTKVFPDHYFNPELSSRNLIEVGYSWAHITDKAGTWITGWPLYLMCTHAAIAFTISLTLPRVTRIIPSALVSIIICTLLEQCVIRQASSQESPTIGDYADIKTPYVAPIWFELDNLPGLSWDTFHKIYLYGIAVFGAGIADSLLTLQIVDELTEYRGLRNRVALGQGAANLASAILGGMGGSASIGQSVIANHSDGITGLSTFLSGAFLLTGIYAAHDAVNLIPLGAVVGVMFWSAFKLIDWQSLLAIIAALTPLSLRDYLHMDYKVTRADSLIVATVMGLTACIDLATAIIAGILIAVVVYAWDSSNRVVVEREISSEEPASVTYNISGPIFFATAQSFVDIFPVEEIQFDPDEVIILLEGAEIFDLSGMVAIKNVYERFADVGKVVALSSLSPTSRRLMEKCAYMWQGVNFLEVEEIEDEEDLELSRKGTESIENVEMSIISE